MADQWIVIRNWDKFQHYDPAIRTPPWIKTYTAELLHSDEYLGLPLATRGLLHGLWAHYALARGVVPADTGQLSHVLRTRVYTRQLKALNHAGFIDFSASKPASTSRARESRAEKEKEKKDLEPSQGPVTSPNGHRENQEPATQKNTKPQTQDQPQPSQLEQDLELGVAQEFELAKLLYILRDRDNGTLTQLRKASEGLPQAAIVKVRESTLRNAGGAGYAIQALRSEQNSK